MIIDKRKSLDYFLVIMFIALSGVPYLAVPVLNILQFLILALFFVLRKKKLNISFLLFFTILFFITLLQALDFDYFSLRSNIGLSVLVLSAYFIVKILEDKFMPYYITVMYYIAIISLFCYISILLVPGIKNFLVHNIIPLFNSLNFANSEYETFLIFNLNHINNFRNSGPFWEPGAFAGYLMIAFMFNVISENKIIEKKNIIIFITIVTTLSTTAFLALFIFLSLIYYKQIKNFLFKYAIVIIITALGIFAYTTLDFLGQKIESRLEAFSQPHVLETHNSGRFVSILRDMQDFKNHEFTGTGHNRKTRFNATVNSGVKNVIRTNGVSDIVVKYGIIFFSIMIYFLYKSICVYIQNTYSQKRNTLLCAGILIVLLLELWSETYFGFSAYWSLLFLQYAYDEKKERGIV